MTVKVIMERTVNPDQQGELLLLLRQLRARAVAQPGYVTGETLTSIDKPGTHIVVSTWNSLADWKTWESHPDRLEILTKIEAILTTPPKVTVCVEPWAPLPESI